MIIIIVQNAIAEMNSLFFNLTKMIIKSVSTTNSLNFDCIITNNLMSIIHRHLIGQTITGRC